MTSSMIPPYRIEAIQVSTSNVPVAAYDAPISGIHRPNVHASRLNTTPQISDAASVTSSGFFAKRNGRMSPIRSDRI